MPRKNPFSEGPSPAERSARATKAVNTSWARCEDRTTRTAKMRAAGPSQIAWHAKRMGFDPDDLTDAQRLQAEAAMRAYFAGLRYKALRTRRLRKEAAENAARQTDDGGAA